MGGVGGCLGRHLLEKCSKVSRLASLDDAIDLQQGSLMKHLSAKKSNQGVVAKWGKVTSTFWMHSNSKLYFCL